MRKASGVRSSAEEDKSHLKQWTGKKLDWLNCVAVDSQVKPGMFETAFTIIQHANAKTGIAILSDRTISDKTSISPAEVYRHRVALKKLGWIKWRRTRTALLIEPLFGRMDLMLEELEHRRQQREVERIEGPLKRKKRIIAGDKSTADRFIAGDRSRFIARDETRSIVGDEHTPSPNTLSSTRSRI
ncbi:hypothetical protein QA635_18565 [Bradyrhizobium brasilense]|uniref:hypothetical protein n=1 Tax=Bradyrhizobium brasilense TaxID=1419277 RepID=UPI0024B212B5|nr:hypothetical protein [Bradyrhizobium australafricanum]WFU36300.1 hypothetical protein QA635_18565 [Bradyrhizobium australafricanum]